MTRQIPLVVILGSTACGKSKLAIDIARRFGGEIISADSMQVYHGLDIVTNKVSEEEQNLAKHHMINFLNPMNRYSVVDFSKKSLDIINNLMSNNKLPIVVGGTNYYIESLIWKSFLIGKNKDEKDSKISTIPTTPKAELKDDSCNNTLIDTEVKILNQLSKESLHTEEDLTSIELFFKKPIYNDAFAHISSEKLWKILEQVDPKSAYLYHLNDKRRIIRCLQIIQEKGKNYSDLLKEVNKSCQGEDKPSLGGPLRFKSTCVLWLDCDNNVLDKILDDRVDQMLERGLLAELENFHEDYNKDRIGKQAKPDYEKGIFQTIGFKEFHEYFMLKDKEKTSPEGNEILQKSIEQMKLSTRRYARTQLKWIRRRFLQVGTRDLPPMFKLETCFDETQWPKKVSEPACDIVESFIKGKNLNKELMDLMQKPENQSLVNNPGKYYCEICDRTFIGTHYIETHLNSKTHKRKKDQLNRKKQRVEEA